MKRYILTGTPGAGKTTILRAMQRQGYAVVDEAATAIIAREQRRGFSEPWRQPGFIEKIVRLQRKRQLDAVNAPDGLQFYDRSPMCTYALCQHLGYPPSPALMSELERIKREHIYQRQVFFIDHLEFCVPTAARRISFEESLKFEAIHLEVYATFGYECILVAAQPLLDRVSAIIAQVQTLSNAGNVEG